MRGSRRTLSWQRRPNPSSARREVAAPSLPPGAGIACAPVSIACPAPDAPRTRAAGHQATPASMNERDDGPAETALTGRKQRARPRSRTHQDLSPPVAPQPAPGDVTRPAPGTDDGRIAVLASGPASHGVGVRHAAAFRLASGRRCSSRLAERGGRTAASVPTWPRHGPRPSSAPGPPRRG